MNKILLFLFLIASAGAVAQSTQKLTVLDTLRAKKVNSQKLQLNYDSTKTTVDDYVLTINQFGVVGKKVGGSGGGTTYTLPIASSSILGGIKVGNGLTISNLGVLSVVNGATNTYTKPQVDSAIAANKVRFGIEDNLGVQDRSIDMQNHTFLLNEAQWFDIISKTVGIDNSYTELYGRVGTIDLSGHSDYGGAAQSASSGSSSTFASSSATNGSYTISGDNRIYPENSELKLINNGTTINVLTIRSPKAANVTGEYVTPIKVNNIPADSTGNIDLGTIGGTAGVTSLATNNGTGIIGGTITTIGTLSLDTAGVVLTKSNASANYQPKGRYYTTVSAVDSTAFSLNASDGSRDTIVIPSVPILDTANRFMGWFYRKPGIDSFYFRIGATTYAVKDSTGGGVSSGGLDTTAIHKTGDETVRSDTKTFAAALANTGASLQSLSPLKFFPLLTSKFADDTLSGIYIRNTFATNSVASNHKYSIYAFDDYAVRDVRIGIGKSTDQSNAVHGLRALNNVTSGSGNGHVAIGYEALKNVSDAAYYNVGIGFSAGSTITGGIQNTFVGPNAGYSTSTGINNNAGYGYSALAQITGSNNVGVGASAGRNFASNGVALGYNAGLNETSSGKLYVQNTSTGGLVVGDFATGQVQINSDIRHLTAASALTSAATFEVNNNYTLGNRGAIPSPRLTTAQRDAIPLQTGAITKIIVLDGGGATSAPTVTISGSGTGATATAVYSAGGFYINVTNGGSGYTPNTTTVSISGGGATAASAYAVVGNSGLSVFCLDCTATDSSVGVLQYWNGATWKNAW